MSVLAAFGAAITDLLGRPAEGRAVGRNGREDVRHRFLADRHFSGWMNVVARALGETS